jgi:hypothetical protein
MNLHQEIMNIQITVDRSGWLPVEKNGYAHGHSDARHAAAELSLKAEARIEELEGVLSKLMNKARYTLCSSQFDELDEYLESLLESK